MAKNLRERLLQTLLVKFISVSLNSMVPSLSVGCLLTNVVLQKVFTSHILWYSAGWLHNTPA